MPREEFMRLSPRFFAILLKAHWEKCRRADQMAEIIGGQLIAMVANTGFKGWEQPRKPQEFMPSEWKKGRRKPCYQSRERVAANIEQMFAGFVQKTPA